MNNDIPAFPRNHDSDGHNGMTLRDYFAAKAMQSFLLSCFDEGQLSVSEAIAKLSYEVADGMLRAREAKP